MRGSMLFAVTDVTFPSIFCDRSKPDPDIIAISVEKIGVSPEEVLLIGDTPYDIDAAARAGVATIAVRCGGFWSDDDLAGAIAIYDGPADLATNLDRSPIMRE